MSQTWRAFLSCFKKHHQFIPVGEKWVNFMGMGKKNDNIFHCYWTVARFHSKQPQCNSTQWETVVQVIHMNCEFCQLQFCPQANTKLKNKCKEWFLIVTGMENICLDTHSMDGFFFSFSENTPIMYCVKPRIELGLGQLLWPESNIWAELKLISSSSGFFSPHLHFPISHIHMPFYYIACVCCFLYPQFCIFNYMS